MLPWIKQVFEHDSSYSVTAVIPPVRDEPREESSPYNDENLTHVVVVGYDRRKDEYVIARVWREDVTDAGLIFLRPEYTNNPKRAFTIAALLAGL